MTINFFFGIIEIKVVPLASEEARGSIEDLTYGRWFKVIIKHIGIVKGEVFIIYSVGSS